MAFKRFYQGFLFDRADYELVRGIDAAQAVADGRGRLPVFAPELHPRGIRELAEPQSLRLVRTMMNLLDTFEAGSEAMERRLAALQALRDELLEGLDVPLRYNTARVILQIIKELIRLRGDWLRRLRLAHDLRSAMLGNPLFIRKLLRRYRLVEMPEHWIPVAFDQHVHDANTKGRKSPAHLIMDAWIKGIVQVQVIYYNYVPRDAAEEVMRAAGIMKMEARIGVEFRSLFRGRFAELIWTPCGFSGVADYLKFLDRSRTQEFVRRCRKAANYRRKIVLETLKRFNEHGRRELNKYYGIEMPPVTEEEFLISVRYGQPSLEHIGELLNNRVRALLQAELDRMDGREKLKHAAELRRQELNSMLGKLSAELLSGRYVDRSLWNLPPADSAALPELNRLSPAELVNELHKVASGFRMTLNLTGLRLEDAIEILYDCRGDLTTLEIFNLKDDSAGERPDDSVINSLRHALNSGNVVKLKNLIRLAMERVKAGGARDRADRLERLGHILRDMSNFLTFYARTPLTVSIGSDSASRPSPQVHGMGMVVVDTLTTPVRRMIVQKRLPELSLLQVHSEVYKVLSYLPKNTPGFGGRLARRFGFGSYVKIEWQCPDPAQSIDRGPGNLATLGGFYVPPAGSRLLQPVESLGECWRYLNSNLKIFLKVLTGFLAAFFTFYYNSDWWFLMWFGAVIWLGITCVRNIIQLVWAGGGFRSSPLLKWNDFVSWQRVADSLFYTGLSVPVLDYLVKTVLLQRGLGWTAEEQPVLVFSGIALANGFYITGHNLLRAFPKSAVIGNWLRAPLSIPLALVFNSIFGGVLSLLQVPGIEGILQQWAAIVSKLASDVIGGVIESLADRKRNIAARLRDFGCKLRELYALTAKLELLLPEKNLPELLKGHKSFVRLSGLKRSNLVNLFYINALDMMYIWMRQPQAVTAMRELMERATPEERGVFLKTQEILYREKSITKLFLNGLVGSNFSRALAFYLHYYRHYLEELRQFDPQPEKAEDAADWKGFTAVIGPEDGEES